MRRGEMRAADVRAVVLQIVAPLVLAALHQHHLDGARLRPLGLIDLAESLASTILLAHGRTEERVRQEGPAPRP